MPYSFECGVCHSTYRLDEKQITSSGIKVTCPKCLNFFFLRSAAETTETPIIEYVVKPPIDAPSQDFSISSQEPSSILDNTVWDLPTPITTRTKTAAGISEKELSDLPKDPPPRTFLDRILVPIAALILTSAGILFAQMKGVIRIQMLTDLGIGKPTVATKTPSVSDLAPKPESKHAFPQFDPNYDAWHDSPAGPSVPSAAPSVAPLTKP